MFLQLKCLHQFKKSKKNMKTINIQGVLTHTQTQYSPQAYNIPNFHFLAFQKF